jgi:purine-nucleoside phosphorylase
MIEEDIFSDRRHDMGEITLYQKVHEAAEAIRKAVAPEPIEAGIILGTGLAALVKEIKETGRLDYEKIPHFRKPSVASHSGRLIAGILGGKRVVAMEGRFHYYEGHSLEDITLPVRVMRALGAHTLVVSGACGGMNPQHEKGDIVLIEDHVNLMGVNPLVGPNDDRLGPRFPDMVEPYSHELIRIAEQVALDEKVRAHRGVYVGVTGPCLETRAEYRFLRGIGADIVGMSIVPEVVVAVHAGLRTAGFGIVTDLCLPDALEPVNIEKIIATANEAEPKLTRLVKGVIERMEKPKSERKTKGKREE